MGLKNLKMLRQTPFTTPSFGTGTSGLSSQPTSATSASPLTDSSCKRQKTNVDGSFRATKPYPHDSISDSISTTALGRSRFSISIHDAARSLMAPSPSDRYTDRRKKNPRRRAKSDLLVSQRVAKPAALETYTAMRELSDAGHERNFSTFRDALPPSHAESRNPPTRFNRDSSDAQILGPRLPSQSPAKSNAFMSRSTRIPFPTTDSDDEDRALHSSRGVLAPAADRASRVDIIPTQPACSLKVGLEIISAYATPAYRYVAQGDDTPALLLRFQDSNSNADVLQPRLSRGGALAPECLWLQIQPHGIRSICYAENCSRVVILRSTDMENRIGPKLYLEFAAPDAATKLLAWVRSKASLCEVRRKEREKLEAEFTRACNEIRNAALTRSTPMRDASSVIHHPSVQADPVSPHAKNEGKEATTPGSKVEATRRALNGGNIEARKERLTYSRPRKLVSVSPLEIADRNNTNVSSSAGLDLGQRRPERVTRSTRSTYALRFPSPPPIFKPRWTQQNPDWAKQWQMPLVFNRTTVDKDDISRLDEGQCLNDNVIGFYMKYLHDELHRTAPATAKRIYCHNSFFYDKLKGFGREKINYDGVKGWTAKVDLLSYDYVIVPVNESYHWWMAIICNPGRLATVYADKAEDIVDSEAEISPATAAASPARETSDRLTHAEGGQPMETDQVKAPAYPPESPSTELIAMRSCPDSPACLQPQVVSDISGTMNPSMEVETPHADAAKANSSPSARPSQRRDRKNGRKSFRPIRYDPAATRIITLDSLGTPHSPACAKLKSYLVREFADKRGMAIPEPQKLGMRALNIPEQDNFCDCGVYVLGYFQQFLRNPDGFVHDILQRNERQWNFSPSDIRNELRSLILDLHAKHQCEQLEARRDKRLEKRAKSKLHDNVLLPGHQQAQQHEAVSLDAPSVLPDTLAQTPGHRETSMISQSPKFGTPRESQDQIAGESVSRLPPPSAPETEISEKRTFTSSLCPPEHPLIEPRAPSPELGIAFHCSASPSMRTPLKPLGGHDGKRMDQSSPFRASLDLTGAGPVIEARSVSPKRLSPLRSSPELGVASLGAPSPKRRRTPEPLTMSSVDGSPYATKSPFFTPRPRITKMRVYSSKCKRGQSSSGDVIYIDPE